MISTPWRMSELMMRDTGLSLPGIVRDEKMTRSPGESVMAG